VLLGGAGVLVLGTGAAVAAGYESHHRTPPLRAAPDVAPGQVTSGSFASEHTGTTVGWSIGYPPGAAKSGLPVLVSLHGRGADHRTTFRELAMQNYLAAYVNDGGTPFAIASVDGGDHSYWHPRKYGDAAAMVMDEFLPMLAEHGLRTTRIVLYGWSMGGYGAMYLASRLGPGRVAACVAESPAIWHKAGQSAPGAFDDADDFNAHSLWTRIGALEQVPLKIDCGSSDGFAPVTRDLRAALSPTPAGGIAPGGHDYDFWRSQAAPSIAFAGSKLT
jgi:S-formylglutathione hydrolase FrmB